ncbi:MAG TPA: M36 family metallopeptidase [Pyrinomonadaceae bacterium]|nr:M36 family metallopeptidase [Pyrinomonadaceae bacterium]
MRRYKNSLRFFSIILAITLALTAINTKTPHVDAAGAASADGLNLYTRPAPNFDLNASRKLKNLRQATGEQLSAVEALRQSANAGKMTVRWNDFGGSPDILMGFAGPAYTGTPEDAGRAFLANNAAVFGISNIADLRLVSNVAALGGHLLRFQQTFGGVDVRNGGIGLVMNANNQVIAASGPYFRDVNVNTQPTISADQARNAAAADLAKFSVQLPPSALQLLKPAIDSFIKQTAAVEQLQPKLGIYPTADGYRLVWKVAKVSTNPFGVYMISVDAQTGEIVARKDYITRQSQLAPTGDIYPKYPCITQKLKDESIIENGPDGVTPCGQERVTLRSFDQSNIVTGVNGTLTGTHALVNNILPTKQPFAQAAKGTWHFRVDDPLNFEARTNEQDQLAEPAEHQDDINAFFFATYLVEYVDYLHVAGDAKHSRIGQGDFPDDYPNKTVPLPATVHMANMYITNQVPANDDPQYAQKLQALVTNPDFSKMVLGMDNAFAVPVTAIAQDVTGEKLPVAANPTFYGHGYLLNDTGLEGTVPYHEGMHAITTPIAGLEGDDEASALNEGQADMWAFTITNNPSLGDYVVNAKGYRKRFRDTGRDPDAIAYIRSARSSLKYSDFGTYPGYNYLPEEHYDGEIYMSTMWDVREMLNRLYPSDTLYRRPAPKDGATTKIVTSGTEIFERDFLGAMYILGTMAPDTYVKSRDALLIADQMLYSSNPTDPDAPGLNHALIEQIFAAHEMGVNARETVANYATISTGVSEFTASQPAPAAPQNVTIAPASAKSLRVSWQPVQGAVAYEVLKRRIGMENKRESNQDQFASEYGRSRDYFAPIREFDDGDQTTTGFTHVAYVDGNSSSYEDSGRVSEVFSPFGIKDLFDHEYVVRAINGGRNGQQLGVSGLSGATRPTLIKQTLTPQIDSAISNVTFSGGVFAFDEKLTNARGALSDIDKTIYGPVEFRVLNISDPTVTVKNGDQGSTFLFKQNLSLGQTSAARRFEFNDAGARMFTFDAEILGNAFANSTVGTGSQSSDGTPAQSPPATYSIFREELTGIITAGEPNVGAPVTYGNPAAKNITYVDVEVTTKDDAKILDATLSSTTAVDLDFELRTVDGTVLDDSGNGDANEHVAARVKPGTKYILRVKGFTNGPSEFKIVSDQYVPVGSPNANVPGTVTPGADSDGGGSTTTGIATTSVIKMVLRFTVNPLTRTVTAKIIQ